jgi:hypothetical protein
MPGSDDENAEVPPVPTDTTNGEKAPEQPAAKPEVPTVHPVVLAMQQYVYSVVSCTMQGLIATLPQFPGGADVLVAMSRSLGGLIGACYQGDLANVLRLRKACKDGFFEAMNSHKPAPMPTAQPPMQTAPLQRTN